MPTAAIVHPARSGDIQKNQLSETADVGDMICNIAWMKGVHPVHWNPIKGYSRGVKSRPMPKLRTRVILKGTPSSLHIQRTTSGFFSRMIRLADRRMCFLYSTDIPSFGRVYGAESTTDSNLLSKPIEPQVTALKSSSRKENVRQFWMTESRPSQYGRKFEGWSKTTVIPPVNSGPRNCCVTLISCSDMILWVLVSASSVR